MRSREVGIGPNDENWLKTNYASQLQTTKSIEELSTQISNSGDYIGKVSFNGKVINKSNWRGITRMSTSTITTTTLDGETQFTLNTRPLIPFTKIDSYTNYKCHREIIDMILDV